MPQKLRLRLVFTSFLLLPLCELRAADNFPFALLLARSESIPCEAGTLTESPRFIVETVALTVGDPGCSVEPIMQPNALLQDSESGWLKSLTMLGGIDGSKQPQDYGVNANLGLQGNVNASIAIDEESGLGLQAGTGIVGSQNAVRVYELLGEATSRTQSYTTIGLFQRTDSGFVWAIAHDFLIEQSYDTFLLSQWRGRVGYDVNGLNQYGITAQLRGLEDTGNFLGGPVSLRTINQGSLYWRHTWETQTQTTFWLGLAENHGENNAVTGPSAAQGIVPLLGADFLAPLNDHFALYGETNLMMPADTGTVDAFLGLQWFPHGGAKLARRTRFSPVFAVAAPTSISVDLR